MDYLQEPLGVTHLGKNEECQLTCVSFLKIMCFRKVSGVSVFNLCNKYAVPGAHFMLTFMGRK